MLASAERILPETPKALLDTGALLGAISRSAYFSCIATDEKGAIRIFNAGAERMLGYAAADVLNKTPADISDPQESIVRAAALSRELGTPVTPGFEALVCKAARGVEDIYELTWLRKDGSRFPVVVSVTALRDGRNAIIGYLLMGTDNAARIQAEEAVLKFTATMAAAAPRKPVALVVEDDDQGAEVLRQFLEAEGFAVLRAISAEDALLIAPKQTLALITLDIHMHGMNGWTFLLQQRQSSTQADVPVIIVSGRPIVGDLARSHGAAAVLQKPISRVKLKATLADLRLLRARSGFAG
jgi:PAS domain S-box-containing protein